MTFLEVPFKYVNKQGEEQVVIFYIPANSENFAGVNVKEVIEEMNHD